MKILFVAAEGAPFQNRWFGDVIGALPKSLGKKWA